MFHVKQTYEVVIIGGGHAGCEASLASSRMGLDTLLISLDLSKVGEMSCNPSIGGVGKGQLTKEIDALGGEMGKNADYTGIQFKRLNTRKGSAVQSSRCQSDKIRYAGRMQTVVASQSRLTSLEAEVKSILAENGQVVGLEIETKDGVRHQILAKSVVVTAGTFMRGLMHTGTDRRDGGRFGERSSNGLSQCLADLGLNLSRLKTGTPPRLIQESIDFSLMERQEGDKPPKRFSFSATEIVLPQVACFLTYTNPDTHSAISANLHRSPLFSGQIKGIGPRYCPSIEDKVVKFPEKPRHQLFFEPESLDSNWIYPNGISTSLPADVQETFVRTIPGCADVKFARHGYAVEYDCIDPRQLSASLEVKHLPGLFLAGQVNGTSGYEEAAAQGLIAGINAALKAKGEPAFTLSRAEAYIGVMIDDLISMGVSEPYRMFTSRAEFRLSLREDNADIRLRPYAAKLGLISGDENAEFESKRAKLSEIRVWMDKTFVKPGAEIDGILKTVGGSPLAAPSTVAQLLRRPEIDLESLKGHSLLHPLTNLPQSIEETLEIETKYAGYIQIQKQELERLSRLKELEIPENFNFQSVAGLSIELRDKLSRAKPLSLAQASSVSGVTPAAISALAFHIRQRGEPGAVISRSN